MRRALDQHHGIGNDESTHLAFALIRIHHVHRFALTHAIDRVVTVHQAEIIPSRSNEIGAFTIAGRNSHAVFFQRLHECLRFLVAPQGKQRSYLRCGGTEQRIGDDRAAFPARIGIGQDGRRLFLHPAIHQQHPGAGGKPGPVALRIPKRRRNVLRIGRLIRAGNTLLFEYLGANRFVGPVDIGLWIGLLGNETVHGAGAFGFLGIVNRLHPDAGVTLEIAQHRFGKHLILGHINGDSLHR